MAFKNLGADHGWMASATQHEEMLAAFPYPPYEIQQQLMINVYEALQHKQIGLFESPTGTGKTLSMICSIMKWLEDERQAQIAAAAAAAAAAAEEGTALPDWMQSFGAMLAAAQPDQQPAQKAKQQENLQRRQHTRVLDEQGNDISEFLVAPGTPSAAPTTGSKRTATESGYISSSSEYEDVAVPEQHAADAAAGAKGTAAAAGAERRRPQLIFCSRTHSQLSQFVGELHRTRYADSVMLVAVGSRKTLCVNDEVLRLGDLSQINERCLDLQRSKASSSRKAAAFSAANTAGTSAGAAGNGSIAAPNKGVVGFMQQPGRQRGKQQRQRQKKSGCPFLSVEGGAAGWDEFAELVLAAPIDVEELASMGRRKKVCPYYGSRRAVPAVDVVLAPYSSVLLPDARDSLGIELQDSVVVFDEAHNLLDAINGAHSTAVSAWQLLSVQRSLTAYYERFKSFLNPANAQNLQLLLRIAAALHGCLAQQPALGMSPQSASRPAAGRVSAAAASAAGRVVGVNDLLFDLGLDNINMFELARWVRDNKMAFKVSGYTAVAVAQTTGSVELQEATGKQQKQQPSGGANAAAGSAVSTAADGVLLQQQQQQQQQELGQLSSRDGVSAIHSFMAFLLSLTNTDSDGRVIIEPAALASTLAVAAAQSGSATEQVQLPSAVQAARGGRMRYVLLNAARHFGRLLSSARSVLLVSGTLAPVEGLRAQLFPELPPERLRHFECGHVVPADQLLAVSIGSGPSGKALNLRHESRGDSSLMDELGQLLLNLAGVVPEGLVVFAPSFDYLEQLVTRWQGSGLLTRLQQRKQLFREPRAAAEVEQVLAAYAAATAGSTLQQQPVSGQASSLPAAAASAAAPTASSAACAGGAVMLCVVGGKLSEGINFGDGLGRCVVMLGMPYPNPSEPELRERMAYLDKQAAAAAAAPPTQAPALQEQQHAQLLRLQTEQQQQQQQSNEPLRKTSAFQVVNAGRSSTAAASHSSKAKQQLSAAAATAPAAGTASDTAVPGQLHMDKQSQQQHQQQQQRQPMQRLLTGREYYDGLCFKAVNQCVGRVVRHKEDYAAVVMVDSRWVAGPAQWAAAQQQQQQGSRQLPVQKLPGWVQRSYVPAPGEFGSAYKLLAQFFARQRQQKP